VIGTPAMTPERFARLRAALDRRQTTLTVLMENVHKPHNYSAVLRSCDAVGIHAAHAVSTDQLVQTYPLSSASAAKWVGVEVHPEIDAACGHLKDGGFTILAADFGDDARDFRDIDYTAPTAILLGAERDGLSAEAARWADQRIVVPMEGLVQSLNVSVACAVILFEAQRQRRAAGMYERRHLADEVHGPLLFEWAYPEIAAYCRQRALPYPPLDADGEIIGDFRRPPQ